MQESEKNNAYDINGTAFVVKPVYSGGGPSEFRQSMMPHPLVYQELPHGPSFGVYNGRLRSLDYENVDADTLYWRLRRQVGFSHTGELTTEIVGPDAEAILNRVFTREIRNLRAGRCSYQIACYPDGGVIMDGVLLKLDTNRYWYVQGDGEFPIWLRAQAEGYDVKIFDPKIWVSQVQGPRSMDVLEKACDHDIPASFSRYFDCAEITIAGQPVVISRTGFTSELGWEVYFGEDVDAKAIGDAIMQAGEPYDIHTIAAKATNARRIEGGLLFSGTDFDETVTPYTAGLGDMVNLEKEDFIGKEALIAADKTCLTWGLQCPKGVAKQGDSVFDSGELVGKVLSSAWSPFLQCGVAIVRFNDANYAPGGKVTVACVDDSSNEATICALPMYDAAGDIPRGKRTDIPEIPNQ